jgi:hypothetical protein
MGWQKKSLLAVLLLSALLASCGRRDGPGPVPSKSPEIEGNDLEGKPMRLSDFRGKVVVLDFWASW